MQEVRLPMGKRVEIQILGAPSGYAAISAAETVLQAEIEQGVDSACLTLTPLAEFTRPIEVILFSVNGAVTELQVSMEVSRTAVELGEVIYLDHAIPRPVVVSETQEDAPGEAKATEPDAVLWGRCRDDMHAVWSAYQQKVKSA